MGSNPTVAELVTGFRSHLAVLVKLGQRRKATADWYAPPLARLCSEVGNRPAAELVPGDLVAVEWSNHFVRTVKALYRWGVEADRITADPFKKLVTPPCGERNRVLERAEMVKLYRAGSGEFRRFLFVAARTMARPGELRNLRWRDVRFTDRLILLNDFKAKDKRKDGVRVRKIPLDRVVFRFLSNRCRRLAARPDGFVFPGRGDRGVTANALRCRMRRAREAAKLDSDGGERVVCYTLRHTGATNACRNGVRDRQLADILGHTTINMTQRYLHLSGADLVGVIDRATSRPGRPAT